MLSKGYLVKQEQTFYHKRFSLKTTNFVTRDENIANSCGKKKSKTGYEKGFLKVTEQPHILNINTKILELVF